MLLCGDFRIQDSPLQQALKAPLGYSAAEIYRSGPNHTNGIILFNT